MKEVIVLWSSKSYFAVYDSVVLTGPSMRDELGSSGPLREQDTFKRWLRSEHMQQRHSGMQFMAYALSHLRAFCGTCDPQPVMPNTPVA